MVVTTSAPQETPGTPDTTLAATGTGQPGVLENLIAVLIAVSIIAVDVFLAYAAHSFTGSKPAELSGAWPIITFTLVGAIFNPTSAKSSTFHAKLARNAWASLVVVSAVTTGFCAYYMTQSGHSAAQQAFTVAAGGLAGLLTDTSGIAVLGSILPGAKALFKVQ